MSNKERKKEISKQPIPTIEECLGFYKELVNLADERFVPYYKMAIEALEQEVILDKIRAEIDSYCSDNRDRNDGLYIAMRIIDKYRESEDKE